MPPSSPPLALSLEGGAVKTCGVEMKMELLCKVACMAAIAAVQFVASAKSFESLAKYDKDPDGEIVSQRVTVATDDNGGDDTIVKTITITREIRKTAKKTSGFSLFGSGDDDEGKAKKAEYPSPPAKDASEPKRLVRYFCKAWKDEDFKRMYGAMEPKYRKSTTYDKFKKLFEDDAEANDGLSDENISGGEEESGAAVQLSVSLQFKNKRVKSRSVKALVIKTPDGFRLKSSPIIPLDLDDF